LLRGGETGKLAKLTNDPLVQPRNLMSSNPALDALVRTVPGSAQETGIVERVRHALTALPAEQRAAAVAAMVPTLQRGNTGLRLVRRLASAPDTATRQLALELAVKLPAPLDPSLVATLRPLLLDRGVAQEANLAAAAALLRSVAADPIASAEILKAVSAGLAKPRAFERLDQLEQRLGRLPLLDEFRVQLEENLPMRCPRCPERLSRQEMIRHLWTNHQLLLDGRRVREPWELAEEMVRGYAERKDSGLLARCFQLAEHADPEGGSARVRALLHGQQLRNGTATLEMPEEQAARGDSACPRCHAIVPTGEGGAVRPVNASHGRLAAPGYTVEVSERGRAPWLEIETPTTVVHRGPEPGLSWTPRALLILLAGPLVAGAISAAAASRYVGFSGVLPVVLLLWLAFLAFLLVRVRVLLAGKPLDRAIDHAWTLLVPQLHRDGFSAEDADFVARLALSSIGHGHPELRESALNAAVALVEKALASGQARPAQLAPLYRLVVEDTATSGADPVLAVARQISRCLEGALPLALAHRLLEHWEGRWWSPGNIARLRALVCDRAFDVGFEVADLIEVGRAAPALGDVIGIDNAVRLARLRLLWTLLASRPWTRIGPALTVFELASHGAMGTRHLDQRPELLLSPSLPDSGPGRRFGSVIEICDDGIRFGGTLLTAMPASIGVRVRSGSRGGYEMMVGTLKFWFREDPDLLARKLERWCHFWFDEFLPQVKTVGATSAVAGRLREREAVTCPECQLRFLACQGDLGIAAGK